jgi:hypothetical protein
VVPMLRKARSMGQPIPLSEGENAKHGPAPSTPMISWCSRPESEWKNHAIGSGLGAGAVGVEQLSRLCAGRARPGAVTIAGGAHASKTTKRGAA